MASLLWNYRRLAMFALAWAALAAAPVAGCSTDTNTLPGDPCAGGLIDDDGNCLAKCDPASCKESNVCVGNECVLRCNDNNDCATEERACIDTLEDDSDTPVRACVSDGRKRRNDFGVGAPCPDGVECGQFHCADGTPCDPNAPACASATGCQPTLYCPNGMQCDFDACGGNPGACVIDAAACPKADDPEGEAPPCNIGRCALGAENPLDGAPCVALACPPEHCTFMSCIGGSVLEMGNANAYCTSDDCSTDDDCAPGYFCGARRAPNEVCGTMKGNNGICGETPEACIDPATINAGFEGTFFEGSNCLMRFSCLKREQCSPCTHNNDCTYGAAEVCYNNQGALSCAPFCSVDSDCLTDSWCAPYFGVEGATGTCAAAPTKDCFADGDCGDGDTCLPRAACLPRSGACQADDIPDSKFCHHCIDDEDCKSATGNWVCMDTHVARGGYSGQKACYDLDLLGQSGSCLSDADCPQSPGGAFGECLDGGEGYDSSHPYWQTCYFPYKPADSLFTCFP